MIDNYDSFTYNLVQYFAELGQQVEVYRNDAIDLAGIERLQPERIVISPGPCTPDEAGISLEVIKAFAGRIPVLGVCLGHQSIVQAFGGKIIRARSVMHGKTSMIRHNREGVFRNLDDPLQVTRYHSLVAERDSLPQALSVSAWTQDEEGQMDEIMGVRHASMPIEGVQFHPESILTHQGHALLQNFLDIRSPVTC
jgi:anthranilate synthase component 2